MCDCFLLSVIRSTKGFFKRVWAGPYECFKITNHTGDDLVTLIQRKEEMVEKYANAFIELAQKEGIPAPKRKTIMYKLRRMSPGEIERVYDARCRFGIMNLT
mgnify:FL=1